MVIGARLGATTPLVSSPAKWFLARLAEYLAETRIPDLNSGLRVFRKDIALRYFSVLPSRFSFTITIAFLSDHHLVKFAPTAYHRREGKSKIRHIHDTLKFVQLILHTVMYFNPSKVLLPVGLLLLFLALIIGFSSLLTQARVMDVTVITLAMAGIQIGVIALIADMIDKKSKAQG